MANAFDTVSRALLSKEILGLQARAFAVAESSIAPLAERVDSDGIWPRHSFDALSREGLLGLNAPKDVGGHGAGMLALAAITEAIGEYCSSSAICYGMHCVGTAAIAAKASADQKERFLRPIAAGQHITTLALSESGTGSHFYISETALERIDGEFSITGLKQFVTNGGHADSYVLSTKADPPGPGLFNLLVVEANTPGIKWPSGWDGFGMRGNSSKGLRLDSVRVPAANLLGQQGEELWFVFEVIAPYFLVAMAGTYLGIAQAAFDIALTHIRTRSYSYSGEKLAEHPVLQQELSELWISVQGLRHMLYSACKAGDDNSPEALPYIFSAKAQAAETSIGVCNRAMTLCGGAAYRENGKLARLLRDARAADVMAPTTHMLKQWTGKALLGLPVL